MTKTSHYSHINNGGVIIGFDKREDGTIVLYSYNTHFGIKGPTVEIPIFTDDAAEFITNELTRLKLVNGTFTILDMFKK